MSSSEIQVFKTLSEIDLYGIRHSIEFEFESGKPILGNKNTETLPLSGFNPDENSLSVRVNISIVNLERLFTGEHAVVGSGAQLGAALMWQSSTTGRRGVSKKILFKQGECVKSRQLEITFQPRELSGDLVISGIIYLNSPSKISRFGFCNEPGSILGIFWGPLTLKLDGDESVFPLIEDRDAKPTDPPWRLKMEWGEEPDRLFNKENFAVLINMQHKDAAVIMPNGDPSNEFSPALKEILSSALTLFMMRIRENSQTWEKIKKGSDDFPKGSIADAASEFYRIKGWNAYEAHEMISSIRSTFSQ